MKAKLGSSCHCFERIGKKREKRGKIEKKGERVRWLFETPNRFGREGERVWGRERGGVEEDSINSLLWSNIAP